MDVTVLYGRGFFGAVCEDFGDFTSSSSNHIPDGHQAFLLYVTPCYFNFTHAYGLIAILKAAMNLQFINLEVQTAETRFK